MIKHFFPFAIIIPFFFSCTTTAPVDETAQPIQQVENGLCAPVYIVGVHDALASGVILVE